MRRARGSDRSRRFGLATLLAVLLGSAGVASAAAAAPDPVLLVHGWRGDPSTWNEMIGRFDAAGRTAVAIDLNSEDNTKNAAQIRSFIKSKGWKRVDIVAQSMGGLSARWYIKQLGTRVVDTYTSLGTPQYGILAMCVFPSSLGGQMCPSSSFLSTLNGGDDTPDGNGRTPVAWTTIYSTTDGLVPVDSSRLDGGACHIGVPGPGHNEMDNDEAIFDHILAAVERTCTGEPRG